MISLGGLSGKQIRTFHCRNWKKWVISSLCPWQCVHTVSAPLLRCPPLPVALTLRDELWSCEVSAVAVAMRGHGWGLHLLAVPRTPIVSCLHVQPEPLLCECFHCLISPIYTSKGQSPCLLFVSSNTDGRKKSSFWAMGLQTLALIMWGRAGGQCVHLCIPFPSSWPT